MLFLPPIPLCVAYISEITGTIIMLKEEKAINTHLLWIYHLCIFIYLLSIIYHLSLSSLLETHGISYIHALIYFQFSFLGLYIIINFSEYFPFMPLNIHTYLSLTLLVLNDIFDS